MDAKEEQNIPHITAAGKKSRGGLNDYSDINRKNVQRVRGDFLSPTFKPKITFSINSVTFNMSCVNLFPDDQYVVINIDETNQRIIIEPCMAYNRDSLKFANLKDERNIPRECKARIFCRMVYEMMGWNRAAKYRSMAIFQELSGKKIIVFNLDECLQVFTEVVAASDGKQRRNMTINMPEDWKGSFGYTLEEIDVKYHVDTTSTFVTVDNKTGERHSSQIEAKLPTPEELIHRPYGGIRARQEIGDEHE